METGGLKRDREGEEEINAEGATGTTIKKAKLDEPDQRAAPSSSVQAEAASFQTTLSNDQSAEQPVGHTVAAADKTPPVSSPPPSAAAGAGGEDASEEAPAKRARTDGPSSAGEGAPGPSQAASTDPTGAANGPTAPDPPRKIGYITFTSGQEACDYFYKLTNTLRHNQDLNEYETTMALDLLKTGHPNASRKLAPGLKAIQVRDVEVHDYSTSCFHLIRPDGSAEDFSARKCLASLFPNFGASPRPSAKSGGGGSHGGRGGGGRFSGGGRDRGGRGPRGGRGRGRGRN